MFGSLGVTFVAVSSLAVAAQYPNKIKVPPAPNQQAQKQGAAPSSSGASEDAELGELKGSQEQYRKTFEELNRLNPFSGNYAGGKDQAGSLGGLGASGAPGSGGATELTGPAAQLQKMLSNPAVQGYLKLFSSPKFAEGAETIAKHPNKKTLLWVEVIFFLLMFLSRSWRLSRLSSSNWGQIVFVNFTHFVFLWAGMSIVIPWMIFGEPYRQLLAGFWQIWFG